MAPFKKCRHVQAGEDPKHCRCAWYAQFRMGGGKPKSYNLGPDLPKARAEHARLEREYKKDRGVGMIKRAGLMSLGDAVTEYLAIEDTRGLTPGSMAAARVRTNALLRYFGKDTPLSEIQPHDLVQWRKDARNDWSIAHEREVFAQARRFFAWAAHEQHVPENPWPQAWPGVPKHKRTKKKLRHHPLPLMRKSVNQVTAPYDQVCELMMLTGLRVAEALGLTADDVVIKRGKPVALEVENQFDVAVRQRVNRTKTVDSIREVELTPRASQIIAERLKAIEDEPSKDDRLWSFVHQTVNKHWQRGQAKAGANPELGTHALRHAFRTACEEAGISDRIIASIMGHGDRLEWSMSAYGTGAGARVGAKGLKALDQAAGA